MIGAIGVYIKKM